MLDEIEFLKNLTKEEENLMYKIVKIIAENFILGEYTKETFEREKNDIIEDETYAYSNYTIDEFYESNYIWNFGIPIMKLLKDSYG